MSRKTKNSQIPIQIRDRISELQSAITWLNDDIIFYNHINGKTSRPDQFLLLMIRNRILEKASCIHELNRITGDLEEMYPNTRISETVFSLEFTELYHNRLNNRFK